MFGRWTARVALLIVVIASCLLLAGAAELAIRWKLGYELLASTLEQDPPQIPAGYARYSWNRLVNLNPDAGAETFDPLVVFGEETRYPPNLFRKSFQFSEQWSSNSLGFRGPEVVVPKPSDTFRIVCLGGSTTEGIGVSNQETYPAYLEQMLSTHRAKGRRIEVINAGFSGLGSRDLFYVFRNLVLPLEPDLLVYYEVGNRVSETEFYVKGPRVERPTIQWIADRFALYRALRQVVGVPMPYRQDYSFTERRLTTSLAEYLMWMGSIADVALKHGVLMVVVEPVDGYRAGLWTSTRVPADVEWQWQRWQPILPEHITKWYEATAFHMEAFATARGLSWIPLRSCVGAQRDLFLYHNPVMYDPVHYSTRGNQQIARCVADALRSRVLPPGVND